MPTGSAFFVQGVNTLSITMTDDDQFLEAVRLQGAVTAQVSSVPEPGTFALLAGLAAGGVGLLLRRRRKA